MATFGLEHRHHRPAPVDDLAAGGEHGSVEAGRTLVGHGIVLALTLINNLEVNEQVLYARMINVEETSLIL